MGKKKGKEREFTRSLLHCSYLACSTFERMADLITQSLHFYPDFEQRLLVMKQYYENINGFIDEISLILSQSNENDKYVRFMYEIFFFYLKDINNNFYLLLSLFSSKYHEFSNIAMNEIISLNRTLVYSVNLFNKIIHDANIGSIYNDNWHLGELELAANEHYRIIIHNLVTGTYKWENAFLIQKMVEKMVHIVSLCNKTMRLLPFVSASKIKKKTKKIRL